jgi:hypothetical protein
MQMKNRKSSLSLMGVLALAICLILGLATGGVANAKKKTKRRSVGSVTLTKTTPTAIPAATAATATSAGRNGFVSVPLTVGKKAKGKVVGWDSVVLTTTFTGSAPAALSSVFMEITAPQGQTVGNDYETRLINPVPDGTSTRSGPLTETPLSPFRVCASDPGPPPVPPCADPEAVVTSPYVGTVGSNGLTYFNNVPVRGTWQVKLFNLSATTTATLNAVSLSLRPKNTPV